jgi:glyoxylase-like metal-dependent hydrolase (beta-lactamase superfamily II)
MSATNSAGAAPQDVTGLAQWALRGERRLPPVEQVRDEVWSIPIPMRSSPISYVTVYAIAGSESITLVDAGWESDEGWSALVAGLATFGATVADVRGVLATHHHLDHVGLARRITEASGAWLGMHPADAAYLADPGYRDPVFAQRADIAWMTRLGATEREIARIMEARSSTWSRRERVAQADRSVRGGDLVSVAGRRVRAIHVPGHTAGQLCYVDEVAGLLFSGDHLLPRISPNISAYRDLERDALGDYLDSLRRVRSASSHEVLPAHEWRFRGASARADELSAHHQARLAELLAVVGHKPGLTAWEIAAQLTWSRAWDEYRGFLMLSAVNETLAHLVHLVRRGDLVVSEPQGVARFARNPSVGR